MRNGAGGVAGLGFGDPVTADRCCVTCESVHPFTVAGHKDYRGVRAEMRAAGFVGKASAIAERHGGAVLTPTGGRNQHGEPNMRFVGTTNGIDVAGIAAVAKSAGWNLLQTPSFRSALGGNESISRPMEEDWVLYGCTRAKAAAVASVKIEIGQGEGEDFKPLPATDPMVRLFKKPNRATSWSMMMEASTFSRLEHGEDWWVMLDAAGEPILPGDTPAQIVQVRPSIMSIERFDKNGFPAEYSYPVAINGVSGSSTKRRVPAHAVLGFVEYDPYNNWRGLGAVDSIMRELSVAYQVQRYVEAMAREGGDPGGFIILPDNASSASIEQAQAEVDEEFGNAANRGRWKVLSGADFRPNTMSPKDMEFEKFMERHDWACAAVTGVPLVVLGILKDATYSNYENGLRAMWEGPNGALTFLRSIEDRINAFFFPSLRESKYSSCTLRFRTDEIAELQRDVTPRVVSAAQVASMGVGATFNEALELCGVHGSVPGGDADVPLDLETTDVGGEADPTTPAAGTEPGAQPNAPEGSLVGEGVQTQLLNGAQMQVAIDIVAQVAAGEIPRESGIALLQTLLGFSTEQAEQIMGTAGTDAFVPASVAANEGSGESGSSNDGPSGEDADGEEEGSDQGDSTDGSSKSASGSPLSRVAMQSRDERLEYAEGVIKRVMLPGERALVQTARGYLRSYLRAQLARLRDFAKHGKAARGFELVEKIEGADEALLEKLLLNRKEWEERLAKLFKPHLTRISGAALEDMADELGGVSVGVNDPRVVQQLSDQVLQLSEGVNSTLAKKVKAALVETFKDQSTIGDLQVAVQDLLPELEGNVAMAFRDRESRALAIARTEAAHATNGARQVQMKAEGVTQTEWATAGDDAVRPEHAALDGEVRAIGSDYAPNLSYPHDPRAPAGQVINCRCVLHPMD